MLWNIATYEDLSGAYMKSLIFKFCFTENIWWNYTRYLFRFIRATVTIRVTCGIQEIQPSSTLSRIDEGTARQYVLTTAHCINSTTDSTITIYAGLHNKTSTTEDDITILQLLSPFDLTKYVQLACLPGAEPHKSVILSSLPNGVRKNLKVNFQMYFNKHSHKI
jgi:hypothetical protein